MVSWRVIIGVCCWFEASRAAEETYQASQVRIRGSFRGDNEQVSKPLTGFAVIVLVTFLVKVVARPTVLVTVLRRGQQKAVA